MRISGLSAASGVPLPTLKFYLREGLLQPGEPRGINQAEYGEAHVRRLRLIRALTEIGGLSLRQVRAVLVAIEDESIPLHELLGLTEPAIAPGDDAAMPQAGDAAGDAAGDVEQVLDAMGWRVSPGAPARASLTAAIATLRDLGWAVSDDDLLRYARAIDELAAWEVASVPGGGSRAAAVEHAVVGTVGFEEVLAALRRLAQEHYSARRFGPGVDARRAALTPADARP